MAIYDMLKAYAEHHLNVLFTGSAGIGKTSMVTQLKDDLDLRYKYYSASTLDVWLELIGVPVPNHKDRVIELYKPKDIMEAEFIFFDEINRASPRVLNAIHEIVQFKSVNGERLPNLKMVWGARNPSNGKYNVDDLDPALEDRFHIYMNLKASFNMDYMTTKMKEETAKVLRSWWRQDMNEDQRELVSPRRLEYMGYLIDNDLPWEPAIPTGALPDGSLRKRLRILTAGFDPAMHITKENLLNKTELYIELVKKDSGSCIKIIEVIRKFSASNLFICRDIVENLPKDMVINMGSIKMPKFRMDLEESFVEHSVNPQNKYPLIYEAFLASLHNED